MFREKKKNVSENFSRKGKKFLILHLHCFPQRVFNCNKTHVSYSIVERKKNESRVKGNIASRVSKIWTVSINFCLFVGSSKAD